MRTFTMRGPALIALAAAGILLAVPSPPAVAAEHSQESPERLAREGMERLLRAIELMIEMIPQYEAPEVLDNGDIIIRRKRPGPDDPEPELEETET